MSNDTREFDLVVWGATGFTGRLVAEYLAQQEGVGGTLRWAVAGRNRARLDAVCEEIARAVPAARPSRLPVVLADSDDLPSLHALCARTRVVISTVGPYALYGTNLVRACAANGTDYCDLTGEPLWIRRMIHEFDAPARASGARIVHCCGFDSVPFDLGVWFLQRAMQERFGHAAPQVHGVVRRMRGALSGGTAASMMNFLEEAARNPSLRRIAADPGALLPPTASAPARRPERPAVAFEPALGLWTGPFVMAAINTKVVRRSNALLDFPWGEDFRYEESMSTGTGLAGRARAAGLGLGLGAFVMAAAFGPTRGLMSRAMPAPGEGPGAEAREKGFYEIDFVGFDRQADQARLIATVSGTRDPGYGSTSRMLAESALCLARGEVRTPGGSWTPASCLAEPLLARLESRAGLCFRLREPV